MTNTTRGVGEDLLNEHGEILVRVLTRDDLDAMTRIDKRIVGRSRRDYLAQKLEEAIGGSRIMVSLGADVDGLLAGFLLGRLFYGEFGVAEPVALLDTIDVDPERLHTGIGRALFDQFKTNLRAVGIERIQTQVRWNDWGLLPFLEASGFEPAPRAVLEAVI